jgi:hypothetical protein
MVTSKRASAMQRTTSSMWPNSVFGAHKFAPRRGVVEQIQHFQRGADRMRRRFDRHRLIAAFGVSLPGFLLFRGAGGQR